MKLKNLVLVLIALVFVGCSSNDDNNNAQLPLQNSFSVTIDGTLYTFNTFTAVKLFDNYEVQGFNDNNDQFYLRFNQNGVLDRGNYTNFGSGTIVDYNSQYYNPISTFSLNNLQFDMNNNVVSADFNGLIYEDDVDLNSNTRNVESGSFNLVFTEVTQDPNLDTYIDATINGTLFESIKHGTSGGAAGGTIESKWGVSDNTIILSLVVNNTSTLQTGTYNFSSSDPFYKIQMDIYNPATDTYEALSTNGTLTIDNVIEGLLFDIASGTFNATATDATGNTYTIENGIFNLEI